MKPTAFCNLILRYENSFAGDLVYFELILSIGTNKGLTPTEKEEDIFKIKYYMFTTVFYLGHRSQVFAEYMKDGGKKTFDSYPKNTFWKLNSRSRKNRWSVHVSQNYHRKHIYALSCLEFPQIGDENGKQATCKGVVSKPIFQYPNTFLHELVCASSK